jgi:hypothetical protein
VRLLADENVAQDGAESATSAVLHSYEDTYLPPAD